MIVCFSGPVHAVSPIPGFIKTCATTVTIDPAALEKHFALALEDAHPPGFKAWGFLFLDLHQDILALFQKSPLFMALFPQGLEKGVPMPKLLESIRQRKNLLLDEAYARVAAYSPVFSISTDPERARALKLLKSTIHTFFQNNRLVPEGNSWRRKIGWSRYEAILKRWKDTAFDGSAEQIEDLMVVGGHLQAFWGELRAAFLVPDVHMTSATVAAFAHAKCGHRIPFLSQELATKEIDIISKAAGSRPLAESWVFTEVKSFTEPLHPVRHAYKIDDLRARFETLKAIAKALRMRPEFQLVLVGGMTVQARQMLSEIGFHRVLGPTVEDTR